MKKIDAVRQILAGKPQSAQREAGVAFAPTNIALCKYWGKRNNELNLPVTSSLSISLGDKGATTRIAELSGVADCDRIELNAQPVAPDATFAKRLSAFLDLFRPLPTTRYHIQTQINIPVAAGLASSACGFAAVVLALDQLYGWGLDLQQLSILARLGSGSASRSLWQGFVEWRAGSAEHGMDSHGVPLSLSWPELRIGIVLLSVQQKPLSSREAMLRTVQTSQLYASWPAQVDKDMQDLKQALAVKDIQRLGKVAETNALAMHATMMSAWPPVIYSQPDTLLAMRQVWQLREQGIPVYFTQDAGPNLKLLFEQDVQSKIQAEFPQLQICNPELNPI